MSKRFPLARTTGRCLSSAVLLSFALAGTNAFGEEPNPEKMALLDAAAPAMLAPVTYNPDLYNTPFSDGDGIAGSTVLNSYANPLAWELYRFCAEAGATVTIETHRTTSAMDPGQVICQGTTDDSAGLSWNSGCGPDMAFVTSADDNNGIPHGVGGSFADPRNVFVAPVTGEYTLAVVDVLGAGGGTPVYEVHADGVVSCAPEGPVAVDDDYSTDEDTPLSVGPPGVLTNDTGGGSEVLYGVDGASGNLSNLYTLDPTSGAVISTIGPIGFAVTGLAVHPATGVLYGTTSRRSPVSPGSLITIDTSTGLGTLVGSHGNQLADITFADDGTFYGWSENSDDLVTVNPANGATSTVGNLGLFTRGSGLSFDAGGALISCGRCDSANFGQVMTINPATGGLISSDPLSGPVTSQRVNGLALNSAGTLFGSRRGGELITIDTTTDTLAVVGPSVPLFDGLVFAGGALMAVLDTSTSNGVLTLNSDGSFDYTPDANFCGEDSFTYHANDGEADSNIATVTITVECVNDAPVANDDFYNATEDTDLVVAAPGVLTNDTDADGDTLTVFSNTGVSHGSLVLNSDGSFTYTPNLNYCGPDSFTYIATDDPPATPPALQSDPATVSISVACVNDPPEVTSVVPAAQTSDYSDNIGTVVVTVVDVDDTSTTLAESDEPPASVASLSLTATGCTDIITESPDEDGSTCTFDYDGQVLDPGDNVYGVLFTPSDDDGAGTETGTHTLNIESEDATVELDAGNVIAVQVEEEGGDSGVFYLHFSAYEMIPDLAGIGSPLPGDLNLMVPYMELIPVGPGGAEPGVCSFLAPLPNVGDGYSQVAMFECAFDEVPVNTYEVVAWVDGASDTTRYYTGLDDGGVVVVFDPSLGFTTGGGWFYWPGTENPDLLTCGEDGYAGDKTNFGYSMKYNKKKTNVQGSLLLQRHTVDANCEGAGKYRVKSNALGDLSIGEATDDTGDYGWAVFGGKSNYREPGDEDGEGNHAFLTYVEDHGDQGGDQDPADEFWIRVEDKDGNVVLEVNGPDSDPAGEDGSDGDDTPIHNGNIIVPH